MAPIEPPLHIQQGFIAAIREARQFVGATAPNPPVGAAALDSEGRILGVAAHQKAGTEHAEARLIRGLVESGDITRARTLLVTLEPCNHQGRTPPCTRAILAHPNIQEIWIGALDPNPRVPGGGKAALEAQGRAIHILDSDSSIAKDCLSLIGPFRRLSTTGKPWVVVKSAHRFTELAERDLVAANFSVLQNHPQRLRESMIPPPGTKTFTSEISLRDAHLLRRESDALLTGSGTVLADNPSFTVRRVPDHPGKVRQLVLLDRRGRVPRAWSDKASERGFEVRWIAAMESWDELMLELGSQGVMQVLVEAGPDITLSILSGLHYDEHVAFLCAPEAADLKCVRRNVRG